MAQTTKSVLEMELAVRKAVNYAYCKSNVPFVQRLYVKNNSIEPIDGVTVTIESQPEFLLPFVKTIEQLPADSTVEIDTTGVTLSPYYLQNVNANQKATVSVTISTDKKKHCQKDCSVTLLPFDCWNPEGEYVDLLAGFVRPRHPEVARLKNDVQNILRDWKMPVQFSGYADSTKNSVRSIAAAIYTALQALKLKKIEEKENSKASTIRSYGDILRTRSATMLEACLLYCSVAESCGLNPIVIIDKNNAHAGLWLYDNCMTDSYVNDRELVRKLASDGVNDITLFDAQCIFDANLNYTGAEKAYSQALAKGQAFEYCVDIKRCRAGGVKPLPERIVGEDGAQLFYESDTDVESAPQLLSKGKVLSTQTAVSRQKQWERRLLDLSLKNMLLHFRPSVSSLHILVCDLAETVKYLFEKKTFSVNDTPPDIGGVIAKARNFDTKASLKGVAELNTIELKNKRLRTFVDKTKLKATLNTLYRRERTALEEMGVDTLYLAGGFLKWYEREDSLFPKYAPLTLIPVTLVKKEGGKGYSLDVRADELQINTTLFEFLKQEFNIELRGLDNLDSEQLNIDNILASVRSKIVSMHGWDVVEDMHLANFSFTRYLMWSDIRYHIDDFAQNALVKSLINNRLQPELLPQKSAKTADINTKDVFLPIVADASQLDAIVSAGAGQSFVLHGPPGTGKSQTITNLIANAVARGKKVLFVAEKMAALSVVKQRLDNIGIGEFCIELHSNKADKADVTDRLLNTLALNKYKADTDFNAVADKYQAVRKSLTQITDALHTPHYLGISLYQAVLQYEQNISAPDVMDIDSTFCDGLTAEMLDEYENALTELAAYARQCGEVHSSPFNDMLNGNYTEGLDMALRTHCDIVCEQIRHLKQYIALLLPVYRHKVRTLTKNKLHSLYTLTQTLCNENEYYYNVFSNADRQTADLINKYSELRSKRETLLNEYSSHCRVLPEPTAKLQQLRNELDNTGVNGKSKCAAFAKRIQRYCLHSIDEKQLIKLTNTALTVHELQQQTEDIAQQLATALKFNRRSQDKLNTFVQRMEQLYDVGTDIFAEYDSQLFNQACADFYRNDNIVTARRFLQAYEQMQDAVNAFFDKFNIMGDYSVLDEDYLDFLTAKCTALNENSDLLANWCSFYSSQQKLSDMGLSFAVEPLLSGKLNSDTLLSCFRKKIYAYYIDTISKEDEVLREFNSAQLEDKIERFRQINEELQRVTREEIRARLIARLPDLDTEGKLSLEIVALQKTAKSMAHSYTLRKLFDDIPHLLSLVAPCMLMSPISVAQYIAPQANRFDLVVFDEASQLPTAEAIGAIARGKAVVVVGDPKQLPPTSFFSSDYVDEEHLDLEDLESVLDDCMALGMTEKHLLWHYRSKHESLIAFSNLMYYGNNLFTFPSPDAMESKVTMRYLPDATYDRGNTKQNKKEAEALVEEVRKRLTDKATCNQSIGIVTFSTAQQDAVESQLNAMLVKYKLENVAYDRPEPLFVKNLENVQGDERDVILFSVGYGPDSHGNLLLNFGPLNQSAGWRRLNVAVTRAREEMIVFSCMTSAMIDMSRTNSKGVIGLKKFLEFATSGRTMLALNSNDIAMHKAGIGKYIAKELRKQGFECRYDLGVSGFRIDVAVVDPRNKKRYALAVLADGSTDRSARDKYLLQAQTLKRLNWNVMRVWTLNFYHNPKREIRRIKDYINKLTAPTTDTAKSKTQDKYLRSYTTANIRAENVHNDWLTDAANEKAILQRMTAIVEKEEPMSGNFLLQRTLNSYGVMRSTPKINARMNTLLQKLPVKRETIDGKEFLRATDECLNCDSYRKMTVMKVEPQDIPPYEAVAAMRSVLDEGISMTATDLIKETLQKLGFAKTSPALTTALTTAMEYGVTHNALLRTASGKYIKA